MILKRVFPGGYGIVRDRINDSAGIWPYEYFVYTDGNHLLDHYYTATLRAAKQKVSRMGGKTSHKWIEIDNWTQPR